MRRRVFQLGLAVVAIAAVVYLLGPRVVAEGTVRFDPAVIGSDPETWLAASESRVAGIRDGHQKEIVWAYPASRARTPLAIVYVHGFSASKGEVRPLPDLVARDLGANLFYTRLAGHGQDGAALGAATANQWIDDFAEAIAIGRRIGERVVVMATSTGGGIAVWAATRPELMQDVAAMILVSPNLGIQASGSFLLTMPWGRQIGDLVTGGERGFTPRNALQDRYWTWRYPTVVTTHVAAVAKLAREAPVETATVPTLFVISDDDRVVRPDITREVAARWGGPHEIETVTDSDDPENHVLAGDALSPSTTERLAARAAAFVNAQTR